MANPVQESETTRQKFYQPRSYSFKYMKRVKNSSEQHVSEGGQDDSNDSEANLADLY